MSFDPLTTTRFLKSGFAVNFCLFFRFIFIPGLSKSLRKPALMPVAIFQLYRNKKTTTF